MRILILICLILSVTTVTADPIEHAHIKTEAKCESAAGSVFTLPPGFYMSETLRVKLDTEVRRLQDTETRLKAENVKLRAVVAGWQPGWKTLTATFVGGIAVMLAVDRL